jgi:PKHD-type hydroxylase
MKGEWCYFKGYLDPAACQQIIDQGRLMPAKGATLGVAGSDHSDDQYRRSEIRFLYNNHQWSWLYDVLWKTCLQANQEFFNVHITKLDYIQMAEYDSQYMGEYRDHHDVFWINGDPVYHRKLTCVVQLSDPSTYQGGDLELIDTSIFPDAQELRQQGTIIFFPSFFMHRARPVTEGVRYSLAAWFDGPKWR